MNAKKTTGVSTTRINTAPSDVGKVTTPLTFQEKCDLIAELSEEILQDPQNAFVSYQDTAHFSSSTTDHPLSSSENTTFWKKTNKVKKLMDMAAIATEPVSETMTNPQQQQQDHHLARLAMVSLLAIFSDILPTYRIRLPTQEELSVRVAKETKAMWDYERHILTHYQSYLKLLERTWELGHKTAGPLTLLTATSMLCLCELLKSNMHFNFRSNVLQLVVRNMNYNCKRPTATMVERYEGEQQQDTHQISIKCCEAVSYVFRTDKQGDISLEAVKLISKTVKDLNCHVHPRVIETFMALPLRVHVDEAEAAKLHATATAKKRKRNREEAEIEDELKESSATLDKGLLARSQADSLHHVTLTYFRVIKKAAMIFDRAPQNDASERSYHRHDPEERYMKLLLPVTLEGLAKFAHLINIDTVVDLLNVLKELLLNVDKLPLDAALNCVLTAFKTLLGPGKELQIDPKDYISPLFAQLPRLCSLNDSQYANLALKCMDTAFIRRRDYSLARVAAFVKRLLTVSMHAPSPYCSAAPLIALVRSMLNNRYSGVANRLFENEQDNATNLGGAYNPMAEDPERTNPFATSAWELGTLRFHIHQDTAQQADDCANLRLMQPATPANLYNDLVKNSLDGYISSKVAMKRHPLRPPIHVNKEKQRKRTQYRFITPRITKLTHLNGGMEEYL